MVNTLKWPAEAQDTVAPTVGFVPESLQYRGCDITLYDLGGGARIRPVWDNYYAEVGVMCRFSKGREGDGV